MRRYRVLQWGGEKFNAMFIQITNKIQMLEGGEKNSTIHELFFFLCIVT